MDVAIIDFVEINKLTIGLGGDRRSGPHSQRNRRAAAASKDLD